MPRLLPVLAALCISLLGLNGCSSYQLGTQADLPFRTLYVEPIKNEAELPQAVGLYSAELRHQFLRDGRVVLVAEPDQADATLSVTLESYGREATSMRIDDTRLARKFDLDVQAVATLRDNRTQKDFFHLRPIRAVRQIYTTANPTGDLSRQQEAEYITQPLLAKTLAERTAATVLDTW